MEHFGQFLTECDLRPMPDGRHWKLKSRLVFHSEAILETIYVPTGFITDLASIPRLFWNILPPFGRYTEAAIVHDWIYRNHLFPRMVCDALFFEMMCALKTPSVTRWTIYLAVRAFGWMAWHDERRRIK